MAGQGRMEQGKGTDAGDNLPNLSERQLAMLQFLMAGKANKEIASELGLGLGTIKQHMAALFKKLNVTSRAMAIARGFAMEEKLQTSSSVKIDESDVALELRPCSVLTLTLSKGGTSSEREIAWRGFQTLISLEISRLNVALVGRPAAYSVDIVFGMHRVFDDNAVRCARLALRLAWLFAAQSSDFALQGAICSGYLAASMNRRGGWTGEVMAGKVVAQSREAAAIAKPGTVIVDGLSRRLIAFAGRAEGDSFDAVPDLLNLADGERGLVLVQLPFRSGLVGREKEFDMLSALARNVEKGDGAAFLVEGEAGMGKTSLCHAVLGHCESRGFSVARFRCGARGLPEMLADFIGVAACAPPALAGLIQTVLRDRCTSAPLAILVDDLHRAQQEDVDLMLLLAGMMPKQRCLLIGAGRRIRKVAEARGKELPGVTLTHMGYDQIKEIARLRASSLKDSTIGEIARRAMGVPLFAVEMARHEAEPEEGGLLPMTLVNLVLSRLDSLPLDRRLLALVARNGAARWGDLAAGWPFPLSQLSESIDTAFRCGIVVQQSGRTPDEDLVTFLHPLMVHVLQLVLLDPQLAVMRQALSSD